MKQSIVIVLLMLAACSGVKIQGVEKADDFSVSKYKTFGFFEVVQKGSAVGPNYESNLNLLKESIIKQMSLKGIALSDINPDLLINIGIVLEEKVQTRETSFTNPADRTAYMGQRNYSWKSEEVEVDRYREGTVTVDLVDRAQNKLVWQGSAQSVVPEKQKKVPSVIDDAMAQLFSKVQ